MTSIKLDYIKVLNYKPKEFLALLEVSFNRDNKQEIVHKEYLLKNPLELVSKLFLEIKSKDKIIFEDSLDPMEMLERYSPILIHNQEEVEEKVFHFTKWLCNKAATMNKTKDAKAYMKLFDDFKTASLQLK